MSEKVNVILNGKIVSGIKGETVLQLARRNGIEIPTLCNDPRLEPYTSCYVCVVEVEGLKGLQPSCSTRVSEGMRIETHNEKIAVSRKTALELILSNHYADCIGPCKQTCPAGVDVQGYISHIEKGQYHEAVALIKETNPLPAICGRVCVRPCEVACRRNLLDEGAPVGIDYLKRFASDIDLESKNKWKPELKPDTGKKVAIIGAGPGGVSAAFFLRKEGHHIDVFEANPKPGGWLRYGIPEYRLPNDILQKEVDNITELGVRIHYNKRLGDNIKYAELQKNYDAVILAIGSQKGTMIGCEGDDAENVFSGIDFLKEMEMTGKPYNFKGKKVAVVGGGNTAMDCCRTSMRCGADKVYVIYRRTEKEMPANPIEIHESKLEGIEYLLLTNPVKVNKDKAGKLKSVTCLKMELGEPDASGRRRPVPIPGSEFDLEVDYILAAIGQKTDVNFTEDMNNAVEKGELKLNRWGDIEANPETLQTGVENVFAAGDGVSGPATLIQAIGQARIAAHSCNLFLNGKEVVPVPFEFLSKKDNFKTQVKDNYIGRYEPRKREEMPTLDPRDRKNFYEVELGYDSEEVAQRETLRCMECGCTALYTCDLKKYATEYKANQEGLTGEFKEYNIDYRHPYIEIDNNKCVLCARCVRICRDVVGANALGLVNRGFDTYVAPSMGDSLTDTKCESCGMCISTCPTGALTENVPFKPGPVKLEKVQNICNYCSIGCELFFEHKSGFVMRVEGSNGKVNNNGNLCRYGKFGYKYLNDKSRLNKPMLKVNGHFEEISFKEAYKIIADKINAVKPDDNAFFAGARLSNEELYLIQKLARAAVRTNNVTSFHYLNRGYSYIGNSKANVPFDQLKDASRIYLVGAELNRDNAVLGYMVNNARIKHEVPVQLVTNMEQSPMEQKVDSVMKVKSYYHFIKAINYYLLANNFQNALFIEDNCHDFDVYKKDLLKENFVDLVEKSGLASMDSIIEFAKAYNNEMNAVIIFSEKEICSSTCTELFNLALITGKLGKTANGLISVKEKNNAQGIFDMGICPSLGVGAVDIKNKQLVEKMKKVWKVKSLPSDVNVNQYEHLEKGNLKNLFIFGEDPLGTTREKTKVSGWLSGAGFVVVMDYFMTDTASKADLVLPSSFPFETSGTFTNTQKVIQEFEKSFEPGSGKDSIEQLAGLMNELGFRQKSKANDVMSEIVKLLPSNGEESKFSFVRTEEANNFRIFDHGCDCIVKHFDEEFDNAYDK
ncbi:MAG: FAD-dependent oxidoreductase [Bacteroidales bacterium]|nr:FAD-dependent oxidoreductase [Bacteroidales bacterium]